MRAALACLALVPLVALGQPKAPSIFSTFPVPEASKELLFYIQRNKNANTIVYEARFDGHGKLATEDPVTVNWIRYTRGGKREPINALESNLAYGVRHKHTEDGVAWMKFVASDKYPFRVEVTPEGQAEARMFINGRYARLRRVEIQAKEEGFWPKILHVDLHGTEVTTGHAVMERIIP